MKKLFLKLSLFTSIIFVGVFLIAFLKPITGKYYYKIIPQKHRFIKTLKNPKIIIGGGSNAAWGINSELISQKTSTPVANMAIHSALGYKYMTIENRMYIDSGDIIIIIPEYWAFFDNSTAETKEFYFAVNFYPPILYNFGSQDLFKIIPQFLIENCQRNMRTLFSKQKTTKNDTMYTSSGFNKYGDYIKHLELPQTSFHNDEYMRLYCNKTLSSSFISSTNKLAKLCKKKKAHFLLSFPSISRSTFDSSCAEDIYTQLKKLNAVKLLGSPHNYVFADSLFFNTNYHLGKAGRNLRTHRLISDLQKQTKTGQ